MTQKEFEERTGIALTAQEFKQIRPILAAEARRTTGEAAPGKGTWLVYLTATDGRVCRWQFDRCTLAHVKGLMREYVTTCPYSCEWTIFRGEMVMKGATHQPKKWRQKYL